MPKSAETKELMDRFYIYLSDGVGKTPRTALAYKHVVSAAISKHAAGWSDIEGLRAYVAKLHREGSATLGIFSSAWRQFREFMLLEGHMVTPLPSAKDIADVGPPADLIYDLWSRFVANTITLTEFAALTWGTVRAPRTNGVNSWSIILMRGGRMHEYMIGDAQDLLNRLLRWGYPDPAVPPALTDPLVPMSPNVRRGLSRQLMTKLIKIEHMRRMPGVALMETYVREALPANPAPAIAPGFSVVAAQPPVEMESTDRASAWTNAAPLVPDSVLEAMEKVAPRRQLSAQEEAEYDELLAFSVAPGPGMTGAALERWRRVRWDRGLPNDLGPPPADYVKTVTPSITTNPAPSPVSDNPLAKGPPPGWVPGTPPVPLSTGSGKVVTDGAPVPVVMFDAPDTLD